MKKWVGFLVALAVVIAASVGAMLVLFAGANAEVPGRFVPYTAGGMIGLGFFLAILIIRYW